MEAGEQASDGGKEELLDDMETYRGLAADLRNAWVDFALAAAGILAGGFSVLLFSGEAWALQCFALLVFVLFVRTKRRTGEYDAHIAYLHRKWHRRGMILSTDGRSANAVPLSGGRDALIQL